MRKLATAAAVSLALASGGAFGLGLGEIEMQSALNQPMNAEIPLTSVQAGELDGMIVQLASPEAFARAGIERSSALTDLTFSVDQSSGVPVIKIESARPITEPFLNFLLEVDWPQGRMVREYTVLLDPPVFLSPNASERNSAADQPAIVQGGDAALVVPTPIERDDALISEGVEVELFDLEETDTPVLSLDEATSDSALSEEGELVSLDGLSDETLLTPDTGISGISDSEGSVVSLSDLGAPNTDAVAELEAQSVDAFNLDDIEVGFADTTEISDDTIIGPDGEPVGDVLGDDGSTIVTLDDIEEPAEVVDTETETDTGSQVTDTVSVASEVSVGSGDTLFEIAQNNAPAGVSVQQMMMAMLAANQSAFINNNINLVRAGAILRVPDADEAARLTQEQALAAIGDQNQLWQDYRDSLRSAASTQVAQNISVDETTQPEEAGSSSAVTETAEIEDPVEVTDPIETAALDTDTTVQDLTEQAQAILDTARDEIQNREELKIVADVLPSDTTASATADETTDSDTTARIGEVNRKLQLAREELSATRLRSTDLSDQASELQSTSENLDALVALRQNEIARLEAQLSEARQTAEDAAEAARVAEAEAAEAARVAEAEAAEAARVAEAEAEAAEAAAIEAAENAVAGAPTGVSETIEGAEAATDDIITDAQTEINEVVESPGTNALTEAGETLAQVELIDEGADTDSGIDSGADLSTGTDVDAGADGQDASVVAATTTESVDTKTWYQEFLEDPKRMAIAGVGALGLLGVMGTLLFRRKRRDPDDSMLDAINEAEFNKEVPSQPNIGNLDGSSRFDNASEFAAAGAAGLAATGAAATFGQKSDDALDEFDSTQAGSMDNAADNTIALSASDHSDALAEFDEFADNEEDIDQDDTISEADVYLAYGLHGQAEELLTKAIEREPESAKYANKLLQTYHAQGNGEAFHPAATDFHQRFGGQSNPEWPAIAAMGVELKPDHPLYVLSADDVAIGGAQISHENSENLSDEALESSGDSDGLGATSFSRDFAASEEVADLPDVDFQDDFQSNESSLMDESLDPAFAFDEGDLEATGDFSAIADEIAAESDDGSVEFPGFDDAGTAANEIMSDASSELDTSFEDNVLIDELESLTDSVDDLTLDLDQLSGDLELDSSELLNSDLSDLDLPDLSADNELLLDSSGALGDGADEMDTMMDLAKAYIDMGDKDSASSALGEIVKSGNPDQVVEAETLLHKIS